jgi:hypothetical protein
MRPEHDRSATLTLANLRTERRPLTVGTPKTAGISSSFGGNPERQHVDAAIAPARGDVLWSGGGRAVVVPRHAPVTGTGFDGSNNLGGDARIDVGA